MYPNLNEMERSLTILGESIKSLGLPKAFSPYVFAVTSWGRVAQGALEALELLPHQYVTVQELDHIDQKDNKKIYIVVLEAKDLVRKKKAVEGEAFDKQHYYSNPEEYVSIFKEYYTKISFLVNCMYWEKKYPWVIIESELCAEKNLKLMGITDISADYEGSCQITWHFLTIEDPYWLYDIKTKKHKEMNEYQNGDILYHCIDHLPSELPYESSVHFGDKLLPFIIDVAKSDINKPFED